MQWNVVIHLENDSICFLKDILQLTLLLWVSHKIGKTSLFGKAIQTMPNRVTSVKRKVIFYSTITPHNHRKLYVSAAIRNGLRTIVEIW